MKIAVMMAAYNSAPYIADALASLLQQRDDVDLDIIVVNDGSTDGTGSIVQRIADEAPEVRLIETPNKGVAAARNLALDAVRPGTDLVTNLDADDLSPAGRFARDIKHFISDPSLEFHYGRMRVFRDISEDRLVPDEHGRIVDVRGIQFGGALFSIPLINRIGRFDESLRQGEDSDYLFRLFNLRPKMKIVDDICVYYRRHESNITLDESVGQRFFARAVLSHMRRMKAGGSPVPPGFFDCQPFAKIDWW